MASSDWSDEDREKSPSRSGSSKKKSGGPPTWLRVLSPISNVMRKGGKVRAKKSRTKARS